MFNTYLSKGSNSSSENSRYKYLSVSARKYDGIESSWFVLQLLLKPLLGVLVSVPVALEKKTFRSAAYPDGVRDSRSRARKAAHPRSRHTISPVVRHIMKKDSIVCGNNVG